MKHTKRTPVNPWYGVYDKTKKKFVYYGSLAEVFNSDVRLATSGSWCGPYNNEDGEPTMILEDDEAMFDRWVALVRGDMLRAAGLESYQNAITRDDIRADQYLDTSDSELTVLKALEDINDYIEDIALSRQRYNEAKADVEQQRKSLEALKAERLKQYFNYDYNPQEVEQCQK